MTRGEGRAEGGGEGGEGAGELHRRQIVGQVGRYAG